MSRRGSYTSDTRLEDNERRGRRGPTAD
jgi:hypothetical protein